MTTVPKALSEQLREIVAMNTEVWAVVPKDRLSDDDARYIGEMMREEVPGKRFVIFGEPVDLVSLSSLDAAWQVVVRLIAPSGEIHGLVRAVDGTWKATAIDARGRNGRGLGETPQEALHDLARLFIEGPE